MCQTTIPRERKNRVLPITQKIEFDLPEATCFCQKGIFERTPYWPFLRKLDTYLKSE